jgi:hypothetical protein
MMNSPEGTYTKTLPSTHVMIVPADGPANATGANVGELVTGTTVVVGTLVGGAAVGVGVEAGAQAANSIAASKIQIIRFIKLSYL